MPPNSQDNLMSLETFRRKLGYSPWFFWQLSNIKVPLTSSSKVLLKEYAWQMGDSAGREEIRQAIASAERKLRQYLGFDVDLRYRSETFNQNDVGFNNIFNGQQGYHPATVGYQYYGFNTVTNLPGWPLELEVGKIKRIGTLTYEEIGNATLTYSDLDGDSMKETFVADFTGDTTTDPDHVVVAVPAADRVYYPEGEDVLANWLIRPVRVIRPNSSTNVLRATGSSSWLFVKPVLYEGALNSPGYANSTGINSSGSFDPNSNSPSPMLTTITFYRKVWTAENNAVVNLYRRDDGTLINSYNVPTFFANEMQREMGYVSLNWYELGRALYSCLNSCGYPGTNVTLSVNYEAGAGYRRPDELGDWQTAVYRFACAELKKSIAGSEQANIETAHWQKNLAQVMQNGGGDGYRVSNKDLDCPWGAYAGAIAAWNMVKDLAIQKSVTT